MRLLGLDHGTRRVGVALGETETRMASPWEVIKVQNEAQLLADLQMLVDKEGIDAFVVGIPRPMGDQQRVTDQASQIRTFIQHLSVLGLPVYEQNETMSSTEAAKQMLERGEKGKRDDLAAAIILQAWLDLPTNGV